MLKAVKMVYLKNIIQMVKLVWKGINFQNDLKYGNGPIVL